ncbi:hypothetical protein [Neorhizobium tomejilense]|uniref:hypothetical protein n=1 Tax=Neorhizobium tomejilense TaxID=2093828 RepID=UPI000CF90612|nr:hypothetical protein [Neorhizobium tomejilense]
MFGSRASKGILGPYLERLAGAYYLTGPQKDALIDQTLDVIAHEPDALGDSPVEKALADAMARVYRANATDH